MQPPSSLPPDTGEDKETQEGQEEKPLISWYFLKSRGGKSITHDQINLVFTREKFNEFGAAVPGYDERLEAAGSVESVMINKRGITIPEMMKAIFDLSNKLFSILRELNPHLTVQEIADKANLIVGMVPPPTNPPKTQGDNNDRVTGARKARRKRRKDVAKKVSKA